LAAVEQSERLLDDSDLLSNQLRARAGINEPQGVGVSEGLVALCSTMTGWTRMG
jgi:hypothetical protein